MWIILVISITMRLGVGMRTIQMTLDDDIVESVDKIVQELGTTRSAFTREALRAAVKRHHVRRLEVKHRRGYELHPVKNKEFSAWEGEQEWGDE
jgi:metal-responsive CopG/Arc/MetJ family transcriptional regulator